jgi:erythrin-vacuolar iron transport family protein
MNRQDNTFVLQTVQPGLAGLMDGSVSTLAPIFAAAFATRNPHIAFVVGVSAAVGAGISMAFAEGLSDDGVLTGRGHPFRRGVVIGLMTFLGGIFHTLPFLLSNFHAALVIASVVVALELMVISYIRYHYFKMRFWKSIAMVMLGGAIVFAAGILIGSY